MKHAVLLIVLALALLSGTGYSQAPAIDWQRSFGGSGDETAFTLLQTRDGGYLVAGQSKSNDGQVGFNHGGTDAWIVKLNSSGDTVWQRSLGGSSSDLLFAALETADGYVLAGLTASNDGDVSGNHGSLDCWVVKLNTAGVLQWQKSYGGSSIDYAVALQQSNTGYIISCTSYSNDGQVSGHHGTTSNSDIWVVSINTTGDMLWEHSYGGTLADFTGSMERTADGYAISGKSNSTDGDVTGNHGGDDYWVMKIDTAGLLQWQKSFGGTGDEGAVCIRNTADGGWVLAGPSGSNDGDITGHHGAAGSLDYWIVKLSGLGAIEWQKSLGGTQTDNGTTVLQTTDGGYFVMGSSNSADGDVTGHHGTTSGSDFWALKLDSSGTIVWQKSLGGTGNENSSATAARETADGGFIVAGGSGSTDGDVTGNHGGLDFWVVKLKGLPTSVNGEDIVPKHFALAQNYPNPFNPSTIISYQLPGASEMRLSIVNLLGEEVKVLASGMQQAGEQSVRFDAAGMPSGIYFYRLVATNKADPSKSFSQTRKMLLVK